MRYFRDLDTAEDAFQEACQRALKTWSQNGPPRDPAAWLIMVARNTAIDAARRRSKQVALPADEVLSDLEDAESALAERLDDAHYRDDILRLLFICCHPDLLAIQQIALALRIVSGLTVKEIARAFLVSESAVEQRITRAKRRVAEGLALIDKAMRHRRPGPYQVQAAVAALHVQAARPQDTDWAQIDLLYGTLERLQPSPVVTLNRAVAVAKVRGPVAALNHNMS